MKKFLLLTLLIPSLVLSACGPKKPATEITPTPIPREMNLPESDRPEINLTPRSDGRELTLTVSKIPTVFTNIEYEVIYSAIDAGLEIEKGVSGNVESNQLSNASFTRKILLGTESCTSGCKYKYDEGVVGGTIILTLNTLDNQVASFETSFKLDQIKGKGFVVTLQN